jgi:hypothetical protein
MYVAMLRAGLAELVAWIKKYRKGGNEGKDKSHRMGLALNVAQHLRAWAAVNHFT